MQSEANDDVIAGTLGKLKVGVGEVCLRVKLSASLTVGVETDAHTEEATVASRMTWRANFMLNSTGEGG